MYKIYDMGDGLSYETANYSNYVINPNVYKKSFIQSGDFDHVNQDVRHFALKT
jgi:hypothetical protein